MQTMYTCIWVLGALLAATSLSAMAAPSAGAETRPASTAPAGPDLATLWPETATSELRTALQSGAGFSFVYGGQKIGTAFPPQWHADTDDAGLTTILRHPDGLTVTRKARLFPEAGAVEYTVTFRNDGTTDLPALTDVKALDVSFLRPAGAADSALTCGGGASNGQFPPATTNDFTLTRTPLDDKSPPLAFSADRGRCSRTTLPFFYLQNHAQDAGLFVAVGWSGQWRGTISTDPLSHTLRLEAGIANLDLRLKPGEEIPGPTILLGCWQGPLEVGSNALRRLLRDRYAPRLQGQPLVPPVMYTTWFQIGAELDKNMATQLIDRAAEMGQEIFEVDASWYSGTPTAPYDRMDITWNAISESLGNWDDGPDAKRFPSGLKPLADRVRARGMQFGLWFEPERAGPASRLAKEHPDWVMTIPGRRWVAVDLGNPAAQQYFCQLFDRYIKELGLKYIRWDMNNHDLLPYWQTKDTPGRTGLTQIRHLEGLHRIEQYILQKHPDIILENCAGGGTRIDLTELAHRHTIWVSDSIEPGFVRYHLEGLNQFLPGSGQMVSLALPATEARKPTYVLPDYNCQVGFAGAWGLSGRLNEWSDETRKTVRRNVDAYKQLRPFLGEDYYLLEGQPRTDKTWAAWQFHNPKTQQGFVQAFRVHSPEPRHTLKLQALDVSQTYRFTDPYTKEHFDLPGDKLLSPGLEFDLPELSSRVLLYAPLSR